MTKNTKSILFSAGSTTAGKAGKPVFPYTEARRLVLSALREDGARFDVTSKRLFKKNVRVEAVIVSKEDGVLAGAQAALLVFNCCDRALQVRACKKDGAKLKNGDVILKIRGGARSVLAAERVALNFLQRLSGIATQTSAYVQKLKGLKTKLLDTRKTTPNLRALEKYAVSAGGGVNHRFSLSDGILIKDNHIYAAGDIKTCVRRAKQGGGVVEVEVNALCELRDILSMEELPDIVMLDNMTLNAMREAVKLCKGKVKLEASGNVRLDTIRDIAKTGVDYVSCGSLTHSVKSLDLSLEVIKVVRSR